MSPSKRRLWPKVLLGAGVLLVIAGVVGAQLLDRYLLGQARAQASALSFELGRPVTLGGLATRFLGGFGVRLEDLEVGAAAGESAPLVKVARVEVRAPLLQALQSRGKQVVVHSAEVEGLTLHVLRLADGTTNLERLSKALDERAAKQPSKPKPQEPTDLSGVRVDRAAVLNGQIRFVDQRVAQARELAVSAVHAEVKDLRAGQPLELKVTAALLTPTPNFSMTVKTTPLDSALSAPPAKVSLKLQPVDLAPLSAFFPPDLGFQAGKVDADLEADLGSAVAGGVGLTKVVAAVHGAGLRFAGSQGGKALDTRLDVDLDADTQQGNLTVRKLELDFGPAGVRGKGSVRGLLTDAPAVQGLELVGHDLNPAVLAAYYPPIRRQLGGEVDGPIGLVVRGEGSQAAQAIHLDLDFTPVRLALAEQLTKAAGAPMRITAQVRGSGQGLRFQSNLALAGVDLRPGKKVNKAPGEALALSMTGSYRKPGGKGQPTRLELTQVTAQVLADTLTGKGFVERTEGARGATRFDLSLQGARLDLDRLLLPSPKKAPGAPPSKAEAPTPPSAYAGLDGHASIQLGLLKAEEMELQSVVLDVRVNEDLVTLSTMKMQVYGGQVDASGSTMRLAGEDAPFAIKAKVANVDAAALLARRTPHRIVSGKLNTEVDLSGKGLDTLDLSRTLQGLVQGSLTEGSFLGADLIAAVAEPIARALPFGNQKLKSLSATSLGSQLPFGVELKSGIAQLKRPISWTRPEATLSFDGGIHLDGTLALSGTVSLLPAAVSALTGGKVTPTAPIPVALRLAGPAWKPRIEGLDVKPAVQAIVQQAGGAAATRLLGDKGGKVVQDVLQGNAKQAAAEALEQQKRAAAEQLERQRKELEAKAAERAREEAAKAQQRVTEEAAKRLKGIFRSK